MSRSNPTENQPNPTRIWYNWSGETGTLYYFDKSKGEKGEIVNVGSKFRFILLDTLSSVRGWHDASYSGISSNEVRDTRSERLVVKAKVGIIAEGFYTEIRDRVRSAGGNFTSHLYIAFKAGNEVQLGSLQLKGAALQSWMVFSKENRAALYKSGVAINGYVEGKKGHIVFRVPVFALTEVSPETDAEAVRIDKEILQPYLAGYFKRTRVDQVSTEPAAESTPPDGDNPPDNPPDNPDGEQQPEENANVPF